MAKLGTHFDTLRAHLGVLGPHLGAPEAHFGGLGDRFASILKLPGRPIAILFNFVSNFAEHKNTGKHKFSLRFSKIFEVRRASKSMKNLKNRARSALGHQKTDRDGQD